MNSLLVNWKTSLAGVVLIVVGIMGAILGIHIPGFSMDSGAAITMGIGLLVAKDSTTPTVIKILLVAFTVSLFLPARSMAADNLPTPVFPIKAPASTGCTLTSCSGGYVGFGLAGSGTSLDILGSGINQSIFGAGMDLNVHAGYQLWNGTYFAAIEAGIGNEFLPNQPLNTLGGQSITGYEKVKLGMGLAGLFSPVTAPATPSQGPTPINIPASIAGALMTPYIEFGAQQRKGFSQLTTGAGAMFLLASHWNLDLDYTYASAQTSLPSENKVTIGLDYHF